jgi:hypothetical protein
MAKAKARERLGVTIGGQQIRCKSGADGIVRMKENGDDALILRARFYLRANTSSPIPVTP